MDESLILVESEAVTPSDIEKDAKKETTLADAVRELSARIEKLEMEAKSKDQLEKRIADLERSLVQLQRESNRPVGIWGIFSWFFGSSTSGSQSPDLVQERSATNYCGTNAVISDTSYFSLKHEAPKNIEALSTEQTELEMRLREFNATSRIPVSIDNLKVGDIVEYRTDEPLNFGLAFQRSQVTEDGFSGCLVAPYWWPVEITTLHADGSFAFHYWGYDSGWDTTVDVHAKNERVRPLKFADESPEAFESGQRVEVRLLQNTHIRDGNEMNAYCWAAGTLRTTDGCSGKVQLDRDSRHQYGVPLTRVLVSLASLRSI